MVINPIVGVYIPTIRIPYLRWDDHPQYKEFRPWLIYLNHGSYPGSFTLFTSVRAFLVEKGSIAATTTTTRRTNISGTRKEKSSNNNNSNNSNSNNSNSNNTTTTTKFILDIFGSVLLLFSIAESLEEKGRWSPRHEALRKSLHLESHHERIWLDP